MYNCLSSKLTTIQICSGILHQQSFKPELSVHGAECRKYSKQNTIRHVIGNELSCIAKNSQVMVHHARLLGGMHMASQHH